VLQAEYDKSVVEKHKLHIELKSMSERMRAATDVMERYSIYFIFSLLCYSLILFKERPEPEASWRGRTNK